MPRRAARICSHPGCPALVQDGSRCPAHPVVRAREPGQQQFYGSARWKALSKLVRSQEPICRLCQIRRSTNVDHVDGDWTNNARENLRALCGPCEKSRTGRQHRAKHE